MDLGAYAVSAVRGVFAAEPSSVESATYRPMPDGFDKQCDEAIFAEYRFPNGGRAKISSDLQATGGYPFSTVTKNWPNFKHILPFLSVKLKAKSETTADGRESSTQTLFTIHNYMGPHMYHRFDITTTTELKDAQGKTVKAEKKVEYKKFYNWATASEGRKGEEWWSTYRFQLEEFVNRVKRRPGSGVWVDPDDSIRQMELIDATYIKAGLPLRPTSKTLEKV